MRIISGRARGTKLYTLDGYDTTRPTLDRVKEALFSKISMELQDAIVLDLFAGSGALGLEAISRGAKRAYIADSSGKAIGVIRQNIAKTKSENETIVFQGDYLKILEKLKNRDIKFDFIFLDPPYKTDFAIKSIQKIVEDGLLNENGMVIIETDIEEDVLENLRKMTLDIEDVKKYGRVTLIFIRRKG